MSIDEKGQYEICGLKRASHELEAPIRGVAHGYRAWRCSLTCVPHFVHLPHGGERASEGGKVAPQTLR